ncbi:42669_t:CDS:2 [Gigaspora margarita]|uniref:42669_t:CDS:1 n=1 Tax=Gigaspora margarita TaxID=4874 RepID=A0ABM8W448_GIGMA|nr:42669_t:CDS:2 [Gigaspora margarita]
MSQYSNSIFINKLYIFTLPINYSHYITNEDFSQHSLRVDLFMIIQKLGASRDLSSCLVSIFDPSEECQWRIY